MIGPALLLAGFLAVPSQRSMPIKVDFCALAGRPNDYLGQRVEVTGQVYMSSHYSYLRSSDCPRRSLVLGKRFLGPGTLWEKAYLPPGARWTTVRGVMHSLRGDRGGFRPGGPTLDDPEIISVEPESI